MTFFTRNFTRLVCVTLVAVGICCVCQREAPAAGRTMIWQSRDQFVAVEPQDAVSKGSPAQPNSHPLDVSLEAITALLSSVDVRMEQSDKPAPLFTSVSTQALAPYLQQAFLQATAGEDVTFAIIGLHDALYGLAKSPRVTTGRAFIRDGEINLIVGLVQQDVNERDDRRLSPFTPGSRARAAAGEWVLMPRSGQKAVMLPRRDWLKSVATLPLPAEAPSPSVKPLSTSTPIPPPLTAAPTPSPAALPASAPAAASARQPADPRSPAERLLVLKDLKERGLISDEEYRTKRQDVLNGL